MQKLHASLSAQQMNNVYAASSDARPLDPANTSFQLLCLLPPALLALVASHLQHKGLLCLQRCSAALHSLRGDESYMVAAWRHAKLTVHSFVLLPEWALPPELCVMRTTTAHPHPYFIPHSLWQAALPALKAAEARQRSLLQLRQWMLQPQPTKTMLATRDDECRLWEEDEAETLDAAGVERVEVMSDINRGSLSVFKRGGVEVRCRLVLQVCPYLQHFSLWVDQAILVLPSHEDTFALLPRLRSLLLVQREHPSTRRVDYYDTESPPGWESFNFQRMLDSLPCLVTLRCKGVYLSMADLLAVACHSALSELHIDTGTSHSADCPWVGKGLKFPSDANKQRPASGIPLAADLGAEEEKREGALLDLLDPLRGTAAPASGEEDRNEESTEVRATLQRAHTALTRTQPTRRSCEVRLALAELLNRRLRISVVHTDFSRTLLRRYSMQAALLRLTLRQQLSRHMY